STQPSLATARGGTGGHSSVASGLYPPPLASPAPGRRMRSATATVRPASRARSTTIRTHRCTISASLLFVGRPTRRRHRLFGIYPIRLDAPYLVWDDLVIMNLVLAASTLLLT